MNAYPKIKSVEPGDNLELFVVFSNGVIKLYDCKRIIKKYPVFKKLENTSFFKNVYVDSGGYGIVWDSELDLSESEIWENGKIIQTTKAG